MLGRAHGPQSGSADGVTMQMWPDECVLAYVLGDPQGAWALRLY